MESIGLYNATVHLALFSRVQNAATLRQRLIAASTLPEDDEGNLERSRVDFAFIDASMITSRLHCLTAVSQALLAYSRNELKSKTLHSEVLWMLEPGSNISEALKNFGLSAKTKDLLLVRIHPQGDARTAKDVEEEMNEIVEGELSSLDALGRLPEGGTDEKRLRKIYKLNSDVALSSLQPGSSELLRTIDQIVTSLVALKSVM